MSTASEDALAAMTSGARVYFLPAELGGGLAQLQWIAGGELWRLRVRGEQLAGFDRVSGAKYDLAKMLPGNAGEQLCAPEALPTSIWKRARVIPQRSSALAAAVRRGEGWLRTSAGWWLYDPRLGDLQPAPTAASARATRSPRRRSARCSPRWSCSA